MAGYVRQSAALIVAGQTIRAAHHNAEYNALQTAFSTGSGHKHDGTAAEGAYVPLIREGDTYVEVDDSGTGLVRVVVDNVTQAQIITPSVPTNNNELVSKAYVDGRNLTNFDPANGDVAMGGFKLTGLGTPTNSTDGATKAYVDAVTTYVDSRNLTDFDPADGDVGLGGFKITNLATPTANTDAANKSYVDSVAFNAALPSQTGNSGKYVTTDGTNASWADVFPSQTGNGGKVLTTNGSTTSWEYTPNVNMLLMAQGIF
ncbi:MAG: hypothetical protein IM557_07910 [Chitinophagaceae bacterium]|nr:hypothetical protein [Chitinophagaceae bacterium]